MKINPNLKKINKIFYNNICIIMLIFVILCIVSCLLNLKPIKTIANGYNTINGQIVGPITVSKKPLIVYFKVNFNGKNSYSDFNAEVLDENKETLYEIDKELWHESGYDSDGYWSESDNKIEARLNFYNPGKYYLKLSPGDKNNRISFKLEQVRSSHIPYFIMGFWLFILSFFVFWGNNIEFIKEINYQFGDD